MVTLWSAQTEETMRTLEIGHHGGPARIASEVVMELQACSSNLVEADEIETARLARLVELTGNQVRLAKALVAADEKENRQHRALLRGYSAMQEMLQSLLAQKTAQPPGETAAVA